MENWVGKVAVVTNAANGNGAEIAKILAKEGLIVCGLAKRKDKVEALRVGLLKIKGQLNAVEVFICEICSISSIMAHI
jgi:NADP+-dependent farnesol dehydrogenase